MNITKHAKGQMDDRGFTTDMLSSFMDGKKVVKEARDGAYAVIGKADGNLWTLIMANDLYTIVTVRRAHKDEEDLWNSR